ncbi:chemotaxis protein CheW [Lysobacter xanthus]
MSKKKRNRRPGAPSLGTAPSAPVALDRDEAPASDVEHEDGSAAPFVDAALAQASARSLMEPADDAAEPAGAAAPPRAMPAASPTWAQHESGDVRGVLIQVGGGRLLLPNATIAEVLSYAEPEREDVGADWLLGRFRWRGWQIPLVAFSRLSGIGEDKPGLGSKVIVLKALGGDRRLPFFAIVTQGFPRLVTVSRSALAVESGDEAMPTAVQARVRLNDDDALLPDLLHIEQCLHELRDAA